MIEYFLTAVNSDDATYAGVVKDVHGNMLLKDAYRMDMHDNWHRYRSLEILSDGDCASQAAALLHMYYGF